MSKTIADGAREIKELFEKAMVGDRQAKQDFISLHAEHFVFIIRERRSRRTQSVLGLSDFLQELRIKVDQCDFEDKDFASWQAFEAYLNRIANNVVGQAERKQGRRGETKSLANLSKKENEQLVDAAAPAVLAVLVAEEDWQKALAVLKTPMQWKIAHLLRKGLSQRDIIAQLRTSEWTVRRTANLLEQFLGGGGGSPDLAKNERLGDRQLLVCQR